jgi:hypothetical protein
MLLILLASCASAPVKLYTLGAPAIAVGAIPGAGASTRVIEVGRVALPDYLDTQDIVVRRGYLIDRSSSGRWASRLSLGVTDLITARLAAQQPSTLVTNQPQVTSSSFRLTVNISRLDVSDDGTAVLDANWTIVPRNQNIPLKHGRITLSEKGAVATDEDVVVLTNRILDRLADRIGQDFKALS